MIILNEVTISYNKNKKVIDSLDLSLGHNMIHGFVGVNGAGKTTLFNAIYGLKKMEHGYIHNAGKKLSKDQMSFLPTNNYFYSKITAREYLNIFQNKKFDINTWNNLFSLPLDTTIETYSTGMKKKLALLGVLKQNKKIIILDEPFNGLDMETCRIFSSILLKLKENSSTILITSHILDSLTDICDTIHFLKYGKIQFSKNKTDFESLKEEVFNQIDSKTKKIFKSIYI